MELQKRSLHMETPRLHASKQVVLEDNVIIPDTNKDADKLLLDRGKITIEEVSSFEDAVTVKGKLHFKALYLTEGNRSLRWRAASHLKKSCRWRDFVQASMYM